MTILINPGSRIDGSGEGWTNTCETARCYAEQWLARMHGEGMTGVELLDGAEDRDGRWLFTFRHKVTGTTATLEMHGIDPVEAYERVHVFAPRIYWNGSSTADPALEDFAAPGFTAVQTFAPVSSSPTTREG
jgi:hypothetical protein